MYKSTEISIPVKVDKQFDLRPFLPLSLPPRTSAVLSSTSQPPIPSVLLLSRWWETTAERERLVAFRVPVCHAQFRRRVHTSLLKSDGHTRRKKCTIVVFSQSDVRCDALLYIFSLVFTSLHICLKQGQISVDRHEKTTCVSRYFCLCGVNTATTTPHPLPQFQRLHPLAPLMKCFPPY